MRRIALVCSLLVAATGVGAPGPPAARAQSAPPPTPVPPFGSPSPYPSSLPTPSPSARPPPLGAAAAALVDLDTGDVLFQQRGRARRPIASLTKIMTALLVVERARPGDVVTVTPFAAAQEVGATLGLEPGERVTVRHLLHALMLQSSNDAAAALAEHVAGSVEGFVRLMNQKARALGLRDTSFRSPSGLDDRGYSTALDLARLTAVALDHPLLRRVVATRFHRIPAPSGPARRLQNRNALLWLYRGAFGVKSGYTAAAGFCFVAAAERDGLRLASVVLGSPFEGFTDSAALLNHGFAAYERRHLVLRGQRFDPVPIESRLVTVEAGGTLTARVRRGLEAGLRVLLDAGVALPVEAGDRVGELVVEMGDDEVGRVALLAAETVGADAPAAPSGPLARRVWEAVSAFVAALARAAFG